MTHRIYLIPGFFGFANVGELKYFSHVRTLLEERLAERGIEAFVHYVPTLPTASIRRRTERLLEIVAGTATPNRDTLHLIGHSTGGLDARLLTAPGISLPGQHDPEGFAEQIKTVVCVSTPHLGTPLAAFFNGLFGQRLLRLLSAITLHSIRLGSTPITAFAALAEALPGSNLFIEGNILDQIYRDLLRDFDSERREDLVDFFGQISAEQSLVTQLTPDAMDLFNASAADRRGVRYGCVLTMAPPPRLLSQLRLGLRPTDHAMYALYRTLHQLTARDDGFQLPELTRRQRMALLRALGRLPARRDNDAVVPTLSQIHGDIIHVALADHHDSIGHFEGPGHDPPHIDWLRTLSRFDRSRFETLWDEVFDYIFPPALTG